MLKKSILFSFLGLFAANVALAQINQGGIPWSMNGNMNFTSTVHNYATPDYSQLGQDDFSKLYMVAANVSANVSFPESGSLLKTDNGYVWRTTLRIPASKAISLYFKEFNLPQGVEMYVINANGKHILGAYTAADNATEESNLVTQAVQGEEVTIELNIQSTVGLNNIKLALDKAASYFRGVDELEYYSNEYDNYGKLDSWDDAGFERSSKCGIEAICAEDRFAVPRSAAVKLIIPAFAGVGYCSGTLVNNAKNAPGNCTRYLLTATHCESMHAMTGSTDQYKNWDVRFNYQTPTCEKVTKAPVSNSVTGVTFVSRDPYDTTKPASDLDADFLLVRMSVLPVVVANTTKLAGWNVDPSHQIAYIGDKKFVFFHHPAGDIKKYSACKTVTNVDAATFGAYFLDGVGAPGSSGSGMFNNEGQHIGIASTAMYGDAPDSCLYTPSGLRAETTSKRVFYAKNSYSWNNPSLPSPANNQKLQPWLSPDDASLKSLNAVNADCTPIAGTSVNNVTTFGGSFNVYPNPSNDGNVTLNIKLNEIGQTVDMYVYDINGRIIRSANFKNFVNQLINLDLTDQPNGTYIIKVSNGFGFTTQKVVVNK